MASLSTLKDRREFQRANGGARAAKPGFVLLGLARGEPTAKLAPDTIRFGLTVTKKIGNAVIRNRARRRLRALALQTLPGRGLEGWDYVLIARDGALTRDFAHMASDLKSALEMLHKARRSPDAKSGGKRP